MKNFKKSAALLLLPVLTVLAFVSCNTPSANPSFKSVIVVCQGSWHGNNGSITHYNTETKVATIDYFERANAGLTLGELPMSLAMWGVDCFIPVEGKVMVIDPKTGKYKSNVPSLNKPSTIGILGNSKGFITDVEEPSIKIFNATTYKVVGSIGLSSAADKMVLINEFIYTNQWSFGKQILKIDPNFNKVVDSIEVGVQPNGMSMDNQDNLWTITDGGYEGNPVGNVDPQMVKISTANNKMAILKKWTLTKGPNYQLSMSSWGANVYYIAGDKLYRFDATDNDLPTTPIITVAGANFSNVVEDPFTGEIYLADAKDYVSKGMVYRYSKDFKLIDQFETGIAPKIFGFIQ